MPRGKPLRNANGYGSVVKLSGNRRRSFEVRVNTHMDERYYPIYDMPGIPFTADELQILWKNKDVPWVDNILIYIYSGWRVSELILMPKENIDLKEGTFKGGLKTAAGKNRIVPIHSKIRSFVEHRLDTNKGILFSLNDRPISTVTYTKLFKQTLKAVGINTYHTPHDCRHTFTSLLDSAGVNQVCIDLLIGHASSTLTTRTYTHKIILF